MSVGILDGNARGLGTMLATFDLASVNANTTSNQSFKVPGLKIGDRVLVNKTTYDAGLALVGSHVSVADTLDLRLMNCTAAPIDAASASFQLTIIRPEVVGNTQFPF